MRIGVVIPARNEVESIGATLERIPHDLGTAVVVADDGSTDGTAGAASRAGAVVVSNPPQGYGWACRAGSSSAALEGCDVLVFLDADGSMPPEAIGALVAPIRAGVADIVCGARTGPGLRSMPPHQRAGNRVIALLLRQLHGVRLSELGPFRAVRVSTLTSLELEGSRFAWPAQMLARAARNGARISEVAVEYGDRVGGRSKVGGSLRGSCLAVWDISSTLIGERLRRRPA